MPDDLSLDPRPTRPLRRPLRGGAISVTAVMILGAISPTAAAKSPTRVAASAATSSAATSTSTADTSPESAAITERRESAQAHLREAKRLRAEGYPATAADHLVTAFEVLDDPKQWRDLRGVVVAMAYDTLLEAYNKAATSDEKLRHGCRLRQLLTAYVDDFRAGFGAEAEGFPEVTAGEQRIKSLELTIRTHGDPATLCASIDEDGPLPTMPSTPLLLTTGDPVATQRVDHDGANESPRSTGDATTRSLRRAKAMTATGAVIIVAAGAVLGAWTYFAYESVDAQRTINGYRATDNGPRSGDPEYDYQIQRGREVTPTAWATGVVGSAALVTGAVLTAVGRKRMRKNDLSLAPTATPTSAGATLRFRF